MNRRELLRLLSIGVPAGILFPSLLTSCRKEDFFKDISYDGKVIIVGGGIAGLYAAYLLNKRKVDVTILEASSRYGGRILPLEGFSDFTIELGAEEVHGQRSAWYDLVRSIPGLEFVNDENEKDYIQLDGALRNMDDLANDADIKAAQQLAADLSVSYDGGDLTADQYLDQKGYAQRTRHYLDALLGNENGTSNDRLGMLGAAAQDAKWSSGDLNFLVKNRSFLSIIEEKLTGIFDHIVLNTQVKTIDTSGSSIVLTDQNGVTYSADKIIITVPLPVLRDGDITFIPSLEPARVSAFSAIGMGAGMKVILKFSNRFWGENCGSIYSDGVVPEYWATGAGGRSANDNLLTAFVMGAYAENLIALGNGMIPAILSDLDHLYGTGVASGSYTDSQVMNWTAHPFIRGAYSYPVVGTGNAREQIAAPFQDKIFFAGEATHTAGHNSTVHGAMETGIRAVTELFKSITG